MVVRTFKLERRFQMRVFSLTGLIFAAAALAAVGCGDDDDDGGATAGASGTGGGSSGAGGGGTGGGGGGGGSGGGSGTATLTGTWDLVGSYRSGESGTGLFRLDDKGFTFIYEDLNVSSVRFDARTGSLIVLDAEDSSPDDTVTGTREAGEAVGLGALPLPIDGKWTLGATDNPQRACFTSLTKSAAAVRCQGVDEFVDWEGAGALSVTHASEAASMFGDLGGTWRAAGVQRDSPESTCELKFEGGTVTLSCQRLRLFSGVLRVTFDGDRVSGTTDGGLEFAASRRN
jgi:hypothetical protein